MRNTHKILARIRETKKLLHPIKLYIRSCKSPWILWWKVGVKSVNKTAFNVMARILIVWKIDNLFETLWRRIRVCRSYTHTSYPVLRRADSKSKLVLNASDISIKLWSKIRKNGMILSNRHWFFSVWIVRAHPLKIHCVENQHMPSNNAMSLPKLTTKNII
jgi:hypothetical protein